MDKTIGEWNAKRVAHLTGTEDLDRFVAATDVALIEFYTSGCGICGSMEPVLSNLAREVDAAVGAINPRDDPPLVERYDVRSVPLFLLFVDGTQVARRADGFVSGDELTAWIDDHAE